MVGVTTATDTLRSVGLKDAGPPKPATYPRQAWRPASASEKVHRRRCLNRTPTWDSRRPGWRMPESLSAPSQLLGDRPVGWVQRMLLFRGTQRADPRVGSRAAWPWASDTGGLESGNRAALQCPARRAGGVQRGAALECPARRAGVGQGVGGREVWLPGGSPRIPGGFCGVLVGVMPACLAQAPEPWASLHSPS